MSELTFVDAVRIARGCTDYGGGYVGDAESHAIYQHGIQTVINALEGAEERGLKDTQTRALHQLGERGQFNLIVQRPKLKPRQSTSCRDWRWTTCGTMRFAGRRCGIA